MSDAGAGPNDGVADEGTNGDGTAGFDGFVGMLRGRLNLRLDDVTPELRLEEDLGLDSIAMFELFVLLEDTAARELPFELLDNVETMADAWSWYSTLVDQRE